MKRSNRLRLLLMGPATLALAACDEEPQQAGVFSTVEECVESKTYTESFCRESLEEAKKQHPKVAPKFSSREECEAQYGPGRCDSPYGGSSAQSAQSASSGGGSVWMPLMMGFLAGKVLGNSQPLYQGYQGYPQRREEQQGGAGGGYRSGAGSWGGWQTGDNVKVANRTGVQTVEGSAFRSSTPKTSTVSRGGFGSRASSVGVSS
ncbi:MAG: DUF1190 domain-containing protein [Alphaproteobacteria bacterium]